MKDKTLNVYVAVISAHRPEAVAKLPLRGTWYVPANEVEIYKSAGAEKVVSDGGSLCRARNRALTDAWNMGLPCVQVSDDLRGIQRVFSSKVYPPASFSYAVMSILNEMAKTNAKLGGVPPTANPLNFNPKVPLRKKSFIVGDLFVAKPCELYFDENLKLKEDYDYTLQHITKYGEVVRVEYIIAEFLHRTNKGGAVAVRTDKLEQESIAYLSQKWGDLIQPNPRKKNEILLKRFK